MNRRPDLILAAFLCLVPLIANAQEKKPAQPQKTLETEDVVRVNTELVQTDVMVFDKDGRFVPGLKREQFELRIDGQPQEISLFESILTGGRNEGSTLRAARDNKPSQPVTGEPDQTVRGRTIIFFINDLHLSPSSIARTHKTITNYINQMMGPEDQVGITSASGQIGFLQQLTDNPAVLHAALERLKIVPSGMQDGDRPHMSDYAAYLIVERNDRGLFNYFVNATMSADGMPEPMRPIAEAQVEQRSRRLVQQSDFIIKNALSSLASLMHATAKLPGRKLVFFVSEGFVPNFTGSDFTMMLRRATSTAARSGVVIYSIDPRGLTVDSVFDASVGSGFDPTGVFQNRMTGERTFTQEPLHALAADTGGRALLNSNALEDQLRKGLDETSRYYLLAWRPVNEAQRASNFSKIKVTIAGRPDLKVQLRRGYLGPLPGKSEVKVNTASATLEGTNPLGVTETSTDDLRAALAAGYKQTSAGAMQLTSSVQLSARSYDGGSGTVVVNVLGAVFDTKGKGVGSFKQRIEVPRSGSQAPPAYATVNHQVDLPPGLYQVRVLAYERGTTKLTNAMQWIEIPKLQAGTFAISSLFLGEIPAAGTAQVGVNASALFARSSRMRFTTYMYNAASPLHLTAQIKVMRGAEAVIAPPEIKINADKVYTGEFPLSSLPPGDYVLHVTVNDKTAAASASKQLRFTIY
jgi:VWFA-related protein